MTHLSLSAPELTLDPTPPALHSISQINFYSGAPALNRLSFHRHSSALLDAHLGHRLTVFVALSDGAPLVSTSDGSLALLGWDEVGPLLGGKDKGAPWFEADGEGKTRHLQGARRKDIPPLVFLGTDERSASETERTLLVRDPSPSENTSNPPVFALDTSGLTPELLEPILKKERAFFDSRKAAMAFKPWEAGVFAQARSMVDWNARNKVGFSFLPLK